MRCVVEGRDLERQSLELPRDRSKVSMINLVFGMQVSKCHEVGIKVGLELGVVGFERIEAIIGLAMGVACHGREMKAPNDKEISELRD